MDPVGLRPTGERKSMTNEVIILQKRFEMMEAGLLGTTGRYITMENENGEKRQVLEPEEIHTFTAWKELGFSVKKGEIAAAKVMIWKYTVKKAQTEEEQDKEKMFMKLASFFTPEQVEPIRGEARNESA